MSKVTSKGQVTIPLAVREAFNINLGDRLVFLKRGDELVVKKATVTIS